MITIVDLGVAYAFVIGASLIVKQIRDKKAEAAEKAGTSGATEPARAFKQQAPARVEPVLGQSAAAELYEEAHVREMRSIPDASDEEDMVLIGHDPHQND